MENFDEGLFQKFTSDGCAAKADEGACDYYQEYCRLFLANVVLTSQVRSLRADKAELQSRLARLEESEECSEAQEKGKRHRRTASEISRHYKCSVSDCQKSYGSEGSLNQHIRLKHPDLFAAMGRPGQLGEDDSEPLSVRPAPTSRQLRLR